MLTIRTFEEMYEHEILQLYEIYQGIFFDSKATYQDFIEFVYTNSQ